jgi:3D (Asp-Asp-Asp) domain-containing protein
MRKTIALFVAAMTIGLLCGRRLAFAQESSATTPKPKPLQAYRLDFSFSEMEDGKKTNTRNYSMNLTAVQPNEIKIGTRVPVATSSDKLNTQFQYIDIGTNIWSQLKEQGDDLDLVVRSEVSNLDTQHERAEEILPPIVRQMKISGDTLLVVGKPILIGSVDDPNSKRQFQLEVTATKLR